MILDINNAFIERKAEGADSKKIEKISIAYINWKKTQQQKGNEYQVSREWMPIYNQYQQENISALMLGDINKLKKMYENLFREKLSVGLHGMHFEMVEKYMAQGSNPNETDLQAYLNYSVQYANNFIINCKDVPIKKLERPPIGNPYAYKLDDIEIYPCAEYHYYYSRKIGTLINKIESPVVLELGGGFGGMAYYLMRDYPEVKYIGVDLPENAALQAYYLMSYFPDLKIKLWEEDDSSENDDYNIMIMPNYAIEKVKENKVTLSYNSYSLAEMGEDAVNNYVNNICRITSKYFLHLNHVHWEINSDNFPINYEKFQLLFRNPTSWGKDLSKYVLDQHEFLYTVK